MHCIRSGASVFRKAVKKGADTPAAAIRESALSAPVDRPMHTSGGGGRDDTGRSGEPHGKFRSARGSGDSGGPGQLGGIRNNLGVDLKGVGPLRF